MKIIIANDYGRIAGGAAKIAIMSAKAFAERGHEVIFLAGNKGIGPELTGAPQIKVVCLESGPHSRDPNRLRGAIRGIYFKDAAKATRELLRGCDPKDTVVHFHAYRETLTSSVPYVASKMGFVTVYTAHEYLLGCPYGGFFDYRKNQICPLRGLSFECWKTPCNTTSFVNKLWYNISQWFFAKVYKIPKRLSHTVFISNLNRKVLRPYLPGKARETIVSNAYDYFDAPAATMTDASPFLFIGTLDAQKDPVTAAKAARKLGAPITFVGSGSLEAEIKDANPDAVLTGWLGREDVGKMLLQSRALVFPSIWYEGQPGTTMEAAGCGVPIIVADLSAAVEQVEQLGVGEIFRGGDADDMAEKMRPYLDTEYARKQGLATQRAYRRLDLSKDKHLEALMSIYRDELSRL